jgi:hypothetical protein
MKHLPLMNWLAAALLVSAGAITVMVALHAPRRWTGIQVPMEVLARRAAAAAGVHAVLIEAELQSRSVCLAFWSDSPHEPGTAVAVLSTYGAELAVDDSAGIAMVRPAREPSRAPNATDEIVTLIYRPRRADSNSVQTSVRTIPRASDPRERASVLFVNSTDTFVITGPRREVRSWLMRLLAADR